MEPYIPWGNQWFPVGFPGSPIRKPIPGLRRWEVDLATLDDIDHLAYCCKHRCDSSINHGISGFIKL